MPRLCTAALAALVALAPIGAADAGDFGSDGSSLLFFWEDAAHFGWSDTPRAPSPVPARLTHRASLDELCARQVGRVLRTDTAALVTSTQMTDVCVRNGGHL